MGSRSRADGARVPCGAVVHQGNGRCRQIASPQGDATLGTGGGRNAGADAKGSQVFERLSAQSQLRPQYRGPLPPLRQALGLDDSCLFATDRVHGLTVNTFGQKE